MKTPKKPDKPREDFPLSPANNGQWCKKIKGKIHYFGVWANPEAAEDEYLRVREYLQAGRRPPAKGTTGVLMNVLCNDFLNANWLFPKEKKTPAKRTAKKASGK